MKTKNEIAAKARKYMELELKRRLTSAGQREPCNCRYNHRQPLDLRKRVDGEPNPQYNTHVGSTLGLCMYGAEGEWSGDICEDTIDAKRCKKFTPLQSKEEITRQFKEDMTNLEWIEEHMPALGELIWVYSDLSLKPSLLFRIWCFMFRIRVKPPQEVPIMGLLSE